jgi:hypothetical protein
MCLTLVYRSARISRSRCLAPWRSPVADDALRIRSLVIYTGLVAADSLVAICAGSLAERGHGDERRPTVNASNREGWKR